MYRKKQQLQQKQQIQTANCSKFFLTDFCRNFSKNMFNRNCLQKKKNSAKIAKVTRNFIARKKTPRKLEYQQALALMSLPTIAEHHHNICTRTFESIMSDPNHKLRNLLPPPYKSNYNLRNARTFTLPRCKTNRFKNSFFMASGRIVNNFQVSYYTFLVLAITIIAYFYNRPFYSGGLSALAFE